MKQIFISYAREDGETAQKLYSDLVGNDLPAWLDKEKLDPGVRWKAAIRSEIDDSGYFIALLSGHSVDKRGYVQKELRQAIDILEEHPDHHIFIVPIRIDDCTPTHELLSDLQWLDLFPSYEEGLRRLINFFKKRTEGQAEVSATEEIEQGSGTYEKGLGHNEHLTLEEDERFKRHFRAKIGEFLFVDDLGFFQMHSLPTVPTKLPEDRLETTFLDFAKTYSWIVHRSLHAPQYHAEGITRQVFAELDNGRKINFAQATCYEDGHIVTEGYVSILKLQPPGLNPARFAYEIQRHLQLSKEVLEGLATNIHFAIRFQALEGVQWEIYDHGKISERRQYAGYHRDMAYRVELSEIYGRKRWNKAMPQLEPILNRLARIFGMAAAPSQYIDKDGLLAYASPSR